MTCFWKDLGEVAGPGKYVVKGIGYVQVIQEDIDIANGLGGNLLLSLIDVGGAKAKVDEYRIGKITPVDDDYQPAFQHFVV